MKKQFYYTVVAMVMLMTQFFFSGAVQAGLPNYDEILPQPPEINPHPPQTPEDIRRVAFADLVLKTFLMTKLPETQNSDSAAFEAKSQPAPQPLVDDPNLRSEIDEACLKSVSCWSTNPKLRAHLQIVQNKMGLMMQHVHTHIIPWSMDRFQKNKNVSGVVGTTYQPNRAPMDMDHMGPANLTKDEYMFHTYAQFRGHGVEWFHVDVIVTEDAKGNLKFERFYIIPMPKPSEHLPDGAVC